MFCPHCGKDTSNDAIFCEYCGKQIQQPRQQPQIPAYSIPPKATQQPLPEYLRKNNGVSVAALICGIIPFITSWLAILLAFIAILIIDANRGRQKGMNLAVIGGMLGVFWIFLGCCIGAVYISNQMSKKTDGPSFMSAVKAVFDIQKSGQFIVTLKPKDKTAVNFSVLSKSADILEKACYRAKLTNLIISDVRSDEIQMTFLGISDQQKALETLRSTKGLPVDLVIDNYEHLRPGQMPSHRRMRREY